MFTLEPRAINLAPSIYFFKPLADSALHPFFFHVASSLFWLVGIVEWFVSELRKKVNFGEQRIPWLTLVFGMAKAFLAKELAKVKSGDAQLIA